MNIQQKLWWIAKTVLYVGLWGVIFYFVPYYAKVFMIIWFGGLFFQSAYYHRYAAHQIYTMSPRMEKIAYILAFLFQGSSYLSAYAYGILHRIHHAYTDTEKDPHTPLIDAGPIAMMRRTARIYSKIFIKQEYAGEPIEDKFKKNLPEWHTFDRMAHSWTARLLWVAIYVAIYLYCALQVDHVQGFQWIVWVVCLSVSFFMGPFHGLIINWYGHIIGYRNHDTKDWSKNIGISLFTIPMNFLMMGEDAHNNHHAKPSGSNFAHKWWEYDIVYTCLLFLNKINIIKLKTA